MEKVKFKEIWDTLSKIDVSEHVQKKKSDFGKYLSYLPWAIAWKLLVEKYPDSTYQIRVYENEYPCNINEFGGFVNTIVIVGGNSRSMQLPVMNHSNKAMKPISYTYSTKNGDKKVEAINAFAINKNIQRCLVKNIALFGLGISLYIGEDIPENDGHSEKEKPWEELRQENIGGKGKHSETKWKDVDGGYLSWCVDKTKNKFSDRLREFAQKEIEWRTGEVKQKDYSQGKTEPKIDKELEHLREDIIETLNQTMKKINNKDEYNKYIHQIKNANDPKKLMLIAGRLKLTEKAHEAFEKEIINKDELYRIYAKAGIANENELDDILNYIHKRKPDEKDNKDIIKEYCEQIEELHKELGYTEIPNKAMNSMKKHLGTDDMHSLTDWKKLKFYLIYLQGKLEKEKQDVPFRKKELPVDPNYNQEEMNFDNLEE